MEPTGYSVGFVLATAIVAIVAGMALGFFMGRRASDAARRYRDVALKLDQVIQEKKSYEAEVVEHFTNTARLLNELTESYREVHNHLAQGADKLCHGSGPVSLERLENQRDSADIPAHLAHIQPPLDYAPKTSPDEKGMLNEEFGLDRKPLDEVTEKVH